MVELTELWLPIVASTLALFFLSFLAWTVLPHHKADWNRLPDEARFLETMRSLQVPPGNYSFPFCEDSKEMASPEFKTKMQEGPTGTLQVWPGEPSMGRNLACQFLFFLGATFCLAYLASLHVTTADEFFAVFRFMSVAAFLTFTAATVPGAIWFRLRLTGYLIDGILYALATGLIFAALWPSPIQVVS